MVGLEGLFGIMYCIVAIPVLTFVPCPFQDSSCVFASSGEKFIERPEMFFREVASNDVLAVMVPVGIVVVGALNATGVFITRYINALARSILT